MLRVALRRRMTYFAFLEFLQPPALPFTPLLSTLLACSISDILHINCVVITRVRCEERIVAVGWVDWRFPVKEKS